MRIVCQTSARLRSETAVATSEYATILAVVVIAVIVSCNVVGKNLSRAVGGVDARLVGGETGPPGPAGGEGTGSAPDGPDGREAASGSENPASGTSPGILTNFEPDGRRKAADRKPIATVGLRSAAVQPRRPSIPQPARTGSGNR